MPDNKNALAALEKLQNGGIEKLGLSLGGKTIEPGQYFPRAEAQSPPDLSLPNTTGAHLAVCLDLDAPFSSFPILGPILHWQQSKLQPAASGSLIAENTPPITNWAPPGPPPGAGPHRYCFFLYKQPEGFDAEMHAPPGGLGQQVGVSKRIRYSLDTFEREAKLGEIVACNYFTSN